MEIEGVVDLKPLMAWCNSYCVKCCLDITFEELDSNVLVFWCELSWIYFGWCLFVVLGGVWAEINVETGCWCLGSMELFISLCLLFDCFNLDLVQSFIWDCTFFLIIDILSFSVTSQWVCSLSVEYWWCFHDYLRMFLRLYVF